MSPEAEPESLALDHEALVQGKSAEEIELECTSRVLKRLCSNEATKLFWFPVDESENAYYEEIDNPICLSQIADRLKRGWYSHFHQFHEDGPCGGNQPITARPYVACVSHIAVFLLWQ